MHGMFSDATSFKGDISTWNVLKVKDMQSMFSGATSFNGDISKWDVSSVATMYGMFCGATSFNCDISKWDVSRVTKMDHMFWEATSFEHRLCGPAWFYTKASKTNMFVDTDGSKPQKECHEYVTRRPVTERELKRASAAITTQSSNIDSTHMITCPKCGTFEKSGRASCCAPGGAWFKNCGAVGNNSAHHRWLEGVAACERKSRAK